MSVLDAVASMREVQANLQTLFSPARAAGPTGPTRAGTSASAVGFADTLAGVTGASVSPALTGAGSSVSGPDVVTAALKYVGVPYVLGGEDSSGIDCSGLVQRAFAELGIDVPRLVRDQKLIGTEVPSLDQARPGDLIVTGGGDHISIYLGDNTVVHAPYAGRDVSVQKLWVGEDGIDTIRRVIPDTPAPLPGIPPLAGSGSTLSALAGLLGGTATSTGSSDPSAELRTGSTAAALRAAQAAYAGSTS